MNLTVEIPDDVAQRLAAALVERFQNQPHKPDALPARDLFVGQRLRVARVVDGAGGVIRRVAHQHDPAGAALMVHREIVHRAVQPRLRREHRLEDHDAARRTWGGGQRPVD